MILDPNGRAAVKTTETTFPVRLVEMLIALEGVLKQNGIGLFCIKCHRLGLPDGINGDNRPESDTYRLSCSCATRVFHKKTGAERVVVN